MKKFLALSLSLLCSFFLISNSYTSELKTLGRHTTQTSRRLIIPKAPTLKASSYLLADADSGRILASMNPNKRIEPASLTKMMTMYIVDQALRDGQIKLTDQVLISKKAWKATGSRMFVKAGDHVTVSNLIHGLVVASGNDAAMALAEHVAGSESAFVDLMNVTAAQLGMNETHFENPSGLPSAQHYTTANNLLILARALILDFPKAYTLYKQRWFTYNNIKQSNRNRLLWQDPSVDGIKTGHHEKAGYCLVASAKRGDTRLISVVTGTNSENARARESKALLNYGFRFFETHTLFKAHDPLLKARVWKGARKETVLGPEADVVVTIVKGSYDTLTVKAQLAEHLMAPVDVAQTVGSLSIKQRGKAISQVVLVSLENDPVGNLWRRMCDTLSLLWSKWFDADETAEHLVPLDTQSTI